VKRLNPHRSGRGATGADRVVSAAPSEICRGFRDDLAVLAVGALTGAESDLVLDHLDGCAHCAALLADYSGVVGALDALVPVAAAPSGFSDRTMLSIRTLPAPHSEGSKD
jgi:hypothetical protein